MSQHHDDLPELEGLVAAEPTNAAYRLALAEAQAEADQWTEAIKHYEQAATLDETAAADIYNELGILYSEIEDMTSSEQAFLKSLERQPGYPEVLLNLGYLYQEQGRYTEALLVLQWCARQTNLGSDTHTETMAVIQDIFRDHGDEVQPAQWTKVTETMGLITAEMITARLRSEGILAWAWQEGAGQALGLSVGTLGTGHVVVMKKDVAQAQEILATELDADQEELDQEEAYDLPEPGPLAKVLLGATAVAVNPLGTGLTFLLSQFSREPTLVTCPVCATNLVLNAKEVKQGWYVCVECGQTIEMT